jgi:hypothetical protein
MARAIWTIWLLAGCGGDGSGDGGDADSDADTDADTDTGTESDTGPDCAAICDTLNVSDLAAADQTPENITMDPDCESGEYDRSIEDRVDGADGLAVSWTELRVYHPPEKDIRHEIRTDYTVGSRCSDGRIEELDAEMHSLRPIFRSVCGGVYCFEGL